MDFEVSDNLTCHRCEGRLLLSARIPHTIALADGRRVDGTRGVGLCPHCDANDPAAQGLLAYFTLHETVADSTEAAALITEWTRRVSQRLRDTPIPPDDDRREIDDDTDVPEV